MNRGVVQSSLVPERMVGGNPNWWSMSNMRPPTQQTTTPLFPPPSSSSSTTTSSSSFSLFPQYPQPSSFTPMSSSWHDSPDLPESWSQLVLAGLVEEADGCSISTPFQGKKMENWEIQVLNSSAINANMVGVKQEGSDSGYGYGYGNEEIHHRSPWTKMILPTSASPRSCVTTSFSSNILDFSNTSKAHEKRHHQPDHSSECNSTETGPFKKARVQPSSSAQSSFKVRKEKLGDRITALHQIVSPFGKTDTASVLLEAIGYIRFLQNQIQALSSPYLGKVSGNTMQPGQWESSCIFPEDPGQLLNDPNCMRGSSRASDPNVDDEPNDLRSRGLCLVPVSCSMHTESDNGADYWTPAAFQGGFQ